MNDIAEIIKIERPFNKQIKVPSSKSETHRAVIIASLANGTSKIINPLFCDDIEITINVLRNLAIRIDIEGDIIKVEGKNGKYSPFDKCLQFGNCGTAIRFFTALTILGKGKYILDGNDRMRKRPIDPLIKALNLLGAAVSSIKNNGCPPVEVNAGMLKGGEVEVDARISSQYVSALMLLGSFLKKGIKINATSGLSSAPYAVMTAAMLKNFGAEVEQMDSYFRVYPALLKSSTFFIEPDASSASYFLLAALITGSEIFIPALHSEMLQGDSKIISIFTEMGADISENNEGIRLSGKGNIYGGEFDMKNVPDLVPTVAVAGLFAEKSLKLCGIEHLRTKESNRIASIVTNITELGGKCKEEKDSLLIEPSRELHRGTIDPFNDHRIAMAFSVAGLNIGGVKIKNSSCVSKSFPGFFNLLQSLYQG